MVCSVAAEEDGDAPDRRGAYGLDGVAMMAALADQPGPVLLDVCPVFNYQQRCGYRVAVKALHMGWCRRRREDVGSRYV